MARPSSSERARRLLALLHLMQSGQRIPLQDVAAAAGTSVEGVTADLETLSMCGVAPYTPSELVPLYIEGGCVVIWGEMPALTQSVRLSLPEAQAIATALQAAGLTAEDELVQRLLATVAPDDVTAEDIERRILATSVPSESSGTLKSLALALEEQRVARIVYQAAGRSEESCREIEPVGLTNERGAWYVEAFCRAAGALRTFRVDRIRSADVLDEEFDPRAEVQPTGVAFAADGLPVARIELGAGETFSEREWPGARLVSDPGSVPTIIEVPYAGVEWIARQVAARLGSARVLEPELVRSAVRNLATGL